MLRPACTLSFFQGLSGCALETKPVGGSMCWIVKKALPGIWMSRWALDSVPWRQLRRAQLLQCFLFFLQSWTPELCVCALWNKKFALLEPSALKSLLWASKPSKHSILTLSHLAKNNSFNGCSRSELWRLRLHDSVLSMCCSVQDQRNTLFAGLSDGTLAVLQVSTKLCLFCLCASEAIPFSFFLQQVQPREPQDEPIYIGIGRAPITSLLLVNSDLWVSCGNHIHIMRAVWVFPLHSLGSLPGPPSDDSLVRIILRRTMDSIGQLTVSANSLDHVLTMCQHSPQGIWTTIKGSSVIELWEPETLKCKLLFDVKYGTTVSEKKVRWLYMQVMSILWNCFQVHVHQSKINDVCYWLSAWRWGWVWWIWIWGIISHDFMHWLHSLSNEHKWHFGTLT